MPSHSGRAKGLIVVVVVGVVVDVVVTIDDVVVAKVVEVVVPAAIDVVTDGSKLPGEHAETATRTTSQDGRRMGRR